MEYVITNLTVEKAKDGQIYVYFSDGRISESRILVAHVLNDGNSVKWATEDGVVRRAII